MLLHIFYKKTLLYNHIRRLRSVIVSGAIGQVIGAIAFVTYIALGIAFKDGEKKDTIARLLLTFSCFFQI